MHQVFKAVDSDDGVESYFYFDGRGGQTIVSIQPADTDDEIVSYFRENGADWPELQHHRARMVNPVLLTEWE